MQQRRIVASVIILLLVGAAGLGYRWQQRSQRPPPPATRAALIPMAALPSSSAIDWKPVPAQLTPGISRVSELADDPQARTERCGEWKPQAVPAEWRAQRECAARLATAGQLPQVAGGGLFVSKARWETVVADFAISPQPGPPLDTWVGVVTYRFADGTSVTVILDDATGTPYVRINHT